MTIKVLNIESWMITDIKKSNECCVRFNRNGFYYDSTNDMCWIEYNGFAYLANKQDFIWKLRVLNHTQLSKYDRDVIIVLLSADLASDALAELFYLDNHVRALRKEKFRCIRNFH